MTHFDTKNFASDAQLKKAGLLSCKDGVYIGHTLESDKAIVFPHTGHLSFIGGAGSNKTLWTMLNALGGYSQAHQIYLDARGTITQVTTLAASMHGYHQYVIAPLGLENSPCHTTDPFYDLTPDSPNLIGDLEDMVGAVQPKPIGAQRSQWPKEDANRWCFPLMLFLIFRDGRVTFKSLYRLLMQIEGDLSGWAENLALMERSEIPEIKSFAGEIITKQQAGKDAFTAPLSELKTTFSFMREPRIANAFCGNDILPSDLVDSPHKIRVMLVFPPEALTKWATPLKAFLMAIILKKRRSPSSRPIEHHLDECGQVGANFDGIPQLYSYGRGEKSLARATFQNLAQMDRGWGAAGREEIMASSQIVIMKGIRDPQTAHFASELANKFETEMGIGRDRNLKHKAVQGIMAGDAPIEIAQEIKNFELERQFEALRAKPIITPGNAMHIPSDTMLVFARDKDIPLILARSKRYFEMQGMAGLYLDDPLYGENQVQIAKGHLWSRSKSRVVKIVEGDAPRRFAGLPQYQNAPFRYVEGYKPRG